MIGLGNVILGGQNASIIRPIPDRIRILRDQIFTASGPLATGKRRSGDLMQADGARVRILNGTSTLTRYPHGNYLSQGIASREFGRYKSHQPHHHHSLFTEAVHVTISGRYFRDHEQHADPHPTRPISNSGYRNTAGY